jgi:hypothetical protein
VKISSTNGNALEVSVVGYQFPNADDPAQRYSWHMVAGTATQGDVSWRFRWQALGCNESSRVGPWLRSVATAVTGATEEVAGHPPRLAFTEPNLAFAVVGARQGSVLLRIEFDLEFHRDRAHWWAGDPYLLDLDVTGAQLVEAADRWDEEIALYPDQPSGT